MPAEPATHNPASHARTFLLVAGRTGRNKIPDIVYGPDAQPVHFLLQLQIFRHFADRVQVINCHVFGWNQSAAVGAKIKPVPNRRRISRKKLCAIGCAPAAITIIIRKMEMRLPAIAAQGNRLFLCHGSTADITIPYRKTILS